MIQDDSILQNSSLGSDIFNWPRDRWLFWSMGRWHSSQWWLCWWPYWLLAQCDYCRPRNSGACEGGLFSRLRFHTFVWWCWILPHTCGFGFWLPTFEEPPAYHINQRIIRKAYAVLISDFYKKIWLSKAECPEYFFKPEKKGCPELGDNTGYVTLSPRGGFW